MAMGFHGDESEATGEVFTLAGFMASPGAWDRFCPRWREMLCETGPYPVDAFHSADIEAAKPPFDGWPIEARNQLVENALDLLTDSNLCANLYAVSCSYVIPDCLAFDPRILGGGSIPEIYERCYRGLLYSVLTRWAFNGLDFIFDEKKKVQGRVKKHFDQAKEVLNANPRFAGKLNDCVFRDDRKVIPLQAADLLAYEVRRHIWTKIHKGENVPPRSPYQRIKDSFRIRGEPPYRERLFRCIDKRFLAACIEQLQRQPDMSEADQTLMWYVMEAPED
jgi:hypothetical protein